MGDVVMALPAAASVKASGGHSTAWMIDSRFSELVSDHPAINSVFQFNRSRYKRSWMAPWLWRRQILAYRSVRAFAPTIALDLQGHSKTAIALKFSGAPIRVVLDPKDLLAKKMANRIICSHSGTHAVVRNLDAVQELGFASRVIAFDVPFEKQIEPPPHFISIHLGGTHSKKIWPVENFCAVAQKLKLPVVLVGGSNELHAAQRFEASASAAMNCVGKLSLRGLAYVLSKSSLHISGDTGTAHIAASFGVKCVTLFGHMPACEYHVWGQPEAVIESDGDVRSIRPEKVLKKIEERLGEQNAN